jgi:hypothetical protein
MNALALIMGTLSILARSDQLPSVMGRAMRDRDEGYRLMDVLAPTQEGKKTASPLFLKTDDEARTTPDKAREGERLTPHRRNRRPGCSICAVDHGLWQSPLSRFS